MEPDAAKDSPPPDPAAPAGGEGLPAFSPAPSVEPAAVPIPAPAPVPVVPPHPMWRWLPWVAVLIVILFQGYVRMRLIDFPLERDEGEYAYAGQLILQGIPPYQMAYNMKLPGTYLSYAALMAVFGETTRGVHLGLMVVNAACIVLVFLVGRKLFDNTVGVMAAASFGLMSLSYKFLALSAHATHFVVLPMLGAVLCLLYAGESGRRWLYITSGLLFGVAFLMKQQAVFFGVFGGAWIVWEELRGRPINWERMGERAGLFSAGCIAPYLWVCIVLWQMGVFPIFWFWTFDYAREYVVGAPMAAGIKLLSQMTKWAAHSFWALMALMLIALVMLWRTRPKPGRDTFVTVFLGFSFLTVCPGFYFRDHYFIPMLPAAALLAGVGVSLLRERLSRPGLPGWCRQLPVLLAVAALALPLWRERKVLFQLTPVEACQTVYPNNPFLEAVEVAKYVREHTTEKDKIAVFGSEPQIYFYTQRHSATGFIYTYSVVEDHPYALQMQAQMAKEIEANEPEYFIYVNVHFSWLTRARAPQEIFDWMRAFCRKHYDVVGVVDILTPTQTEYRWDAAAKDYLPKSERNILVFKRKPAS